MRRTVSCVILYVERLQLCTVVPTKRLTTSLGPNTLVTRFVRMSFNRCHSTEKPTMNTDTLAYS